MNQANKASLRKQMSYQIWERLAHCPTDHPIYFMNVGKTKNNFGKKKPKKKKKKKGNFG